MRPFLLCFFCDQDMFCLGSGTKTRKMSSRTEGEFPYTLWPFFSFHYITKCSCFLTAWKCLFLPSLSVSLRPTPISSNVINCNPSKILLPRTPLPHPVCMDCIMADYPTPQLPSFSQKETISSLLRRTFQSSFLRSQGMVHAEGRGKSEAQETFQSTVIISSDHNTFGSNCTASFNYIVF